MPSRRAEGAVDDDATRATLPAVGFVAMGGDIVNRPLAGDASRPASRA